MLEQLLVEHGAPTLAKLKVGNLIQTVVHDDAAFEEERLRLARMLAPKGVSLTILRKSDGHALVYLYRPKALKKLLACPLIQNFLQKEGYEIFHFTGREVNNNPMKAALDCLSCLAGKKPFQMFCPDVQRVFAGTGQGMCRTCVGAAAVL